MNRTRSLATLLCLLPLVACSGPDAGPAGTELERAAEAPAAADLAEDTVAATAHSSVVPADWRGWVQTRADAMSSADPERYNALMSLVAEPTRAGTLRLRGDHLRTPEAAAVLLRRLTTKSEPTEVRAAIVEALPRTGADVGAAVADLLSTETDPVVREMLAETLWRSDSPAAVPGLRRAMADATPAVRAAAVRAAVRNPNRDALADALVAALADADASTRVEAIRAVGALELDAAKPQLASLLNDEAADVRLASLRALGRVDAAWAASRPEVTTLQSDDDARVARAAADLAAR